MQLLRAVLGLHQHGDVPYLGHVVLDRVVDGADEPALEELEQCRGGDGLGAREEGERGVRAGWGGRGVGRVAAAPAAEVDEALVPGDDGAEGAGELVGLGVAFEDVV